MCLKMLIIFLLFYSVKKEVKKKSSHQKMNEHIKDALNDPLYQLYPEDYEVRCELYDIFRYGDEEYMYTRYDIMCKEIE